MSGDDFYFMKADPKVVGRAEKIQKALDNFKSFYARDKSTDIEYIDNASLLISAVYYQLLQDSIKIYTPTRVNKFKMASLLEMVIVRVQPFKGSTQSIQRNYNGEFAFFAALSLVISMPPAHFEKSTSIKVVEDLFDSLKKQHLDWLKNKNIHSMPVFCNGAFLCLFFLLYKSEQPAMAHT